MKLKFVEFLLILVVPFFKILPLNDGHNSPLKSTQLVEMVGKTSLVKPSAEEVMAGKVIPGYIITDNF